jgi:hypothetical protein
MDGPPVLPRKPLEQGDEKDRGFPGAGLGLDADVFSLETFGQGLFLDGKTTLEIGFLNAPQKIRMQIETFELHIELPNFLHAK